MERCKSTAGTSVHPTKNRRAWPQQVTNSIVQTVLVFGVLTVGQGSSLETAAVGQWCLCSIHYCNCPFITFIKEKNKEKKKKKRRSLIHSLDVPHLLLTLYHQIMPVFISVNLGRTLRLIGESLVQLEPSKLLLAAGLCFSVAAIQAF